MAELVFVIFTEHSSSLLLSDRASGSFSTSAIANTSHVSTLVGWVLPAAGSRSPSIAGTTGQMVRHLGSISLQSTDGSSTMERNDASLQE